jgi:hypothetical protein
LDISYFEYYFHISPSSACQPVSSSKAHVATRDEGNGLRLELSENPSDLR